MIICAKAFLTLEKIGKYEYVVLCDGWYKCNVPATSDETAEQWFYSNF